MTRLFAVIENEDVGFSHPAAFYAPTGANRLVAGVPKSDPKVLAQLTESMPGPFSLLYVLHTPRSEGLPGRYQSPELDLVGVQRFLNEFRALLMSDGRYDLWVHCVSSGGTLVWDRHDLIYAYGDLIQYRGVLDREGYVPGELNIPSPHSHHYKAENDPEAARLLSIFPWVRTDLRKEDEQ